VTIAEYRDYHILSSPTRLISNSSNMKLSLHLV